MRTTARGRKVRETRRVNQVKNLVASKRIGAADQKNIIDLLTKDVHTKRGLERSKRLENLLFNDTSKKSIQQLKRFKEFEGLKKLETESINRKDVIKSIGRKDYDWYRDNRNLILDYNKTYKKYQKKYGAGFARVDNANYNPKGHQELNREKPTIDIMVEWNEYTRGSKFKKIKDPFKK